MTTAPVLCLDIATCTGACVGVGDTLPALSHVRLPSERDDGGRTFHAFRSWLVGMVHEHRPSDIVFESPILPRPFLKAVPGRKPQIISPTNIVTTRRLQGLAAITEEVAFVEGVACHEVSVGEVKTALTSYGSATKADMMLVAQQYGLEPAIHDEADAFGVWLCAIRALRPLYAPNFDMAFGRPARRMA
jgi:hypothetical protein